MSEGCERHEPLHSAWIDGELSAGERATLGEHLQRCPRCRREIAGLRVTRSMLRSMPVRELPPGLLSAPTTAGEPARRRADASPPARGPAPQPRPPRRDGRVRRVAARATAGAVAAISLIGVAAFAAGGPPDSNTRTVAVPVEVFVADHLVRAVGGPVSTPVLLEGRP